jgi:hypothetical protein
LLPIVKVRCDEYSHGLVFKQNGPGVSTTS